MKQIVNIIVVLVFLCYSAGLNAQSKAKFGHIDSNELLQAMPGKDSAQAKLKEYTKTIEEQFQGMQTELETKYQDFLAKESTMTDLIKQTKTKELQEMQARIDEFQTSAQKDLQNKEAELLTPIIDKAKKAIEDVAKEGGYTYVFDSGVGVLLYSEPSDDILPLVKKKLGIN